MTPYEVKEIGGITVYSCFIGSLDRSNARNNERMAAMIMTKAVFGPDALYCHRPDGAPYVLADGREQYISVSHGAGHVLIAVPPKGLAVGVDIERWRETLLRVAHKFLTPDERDRYGSVPELLLKAWTAKEAVFKAAGCPELVISQIETFVDTDHPFAIAGLDRENAPRFAVHFQNSFPVIVALAMPLTHS